MVYKMFNLMKGNYVRKCKHMEVDFLIQVCVFWYDYMYILFDWKNIWQYYWLKTGFQSVLYCKSSGMYESVGNLKIIRTTALSMRQKWLLIAPNNELLICQCVKLTFSQNFRTSTLFLRVFGKESNIFLLLSTS